MRREMRFILRCHVLVPNSRWQKTILFQLKVKSFLTCHSLSHPETIGGNNKVFM